MRGAVLALVVLTGCSALFVRPAPSHTRWGDRPSCTTSGALPEADAIGAVTSALALGWGVAVYADHLSGSSDEWLLVPFLAVPILLYGGSWWRGRSEVRRCRFLDERGRRERGE